MGKPEVLEKEAKKKMVDPETVYLREPWEVEVPGVGTVLARDPSEGDKIEARKAARKHPLWDELTDAERAAEYQKHLARIMLVDPKFSEEDYYKANSVKLEAILDCVSMEYHRRVHELTKLRESKIRDFLGRLKEGSLLSSGS